VAISCRQLTQFSFSYSVVQLLNTKFQFSNFACTLLYPHSLGSPELNCSKRFSMSLRKLRHGPRRKYRLYYCSVFSARCVATSTARTTENRKALLAVPIYLWVSVACWPSRLKPIAVQTVKYYILRATPLCSIVTKLLEIKCRHPLLY
jgi:hypothetical protein